MIHCGIDVGSRSTKIVLVDMALNTIIADGISDTELYSDSILRGLLDKVLQKAGRRESDIRRTIATGYGRELVTFADKTLTEITCHAKGVRHFMPDTRTIIEIGGQDSKVAKLDEKGIMVDFAMNDRCAAGTGRFLEAVAKIMATDLACLDGLALRAKSSAAISSTCVVFAESEIIGLLSQRVSREDIVSGVQQSIAVRIKGLLGRSVIAPVVFTGGVALAPSMARALEKELGLSIAVCPHSQFTGALGAALVEI